MPIPLLEVIKPGVSATVQDTGRPGWKRFGIPISGWMDSHSAGWANRLVGNLRRAPVVECAWHGARFRALESMRIAMAGACEKWEGMLVRAGDVIEIRKSLGGVWSYLAIDGGFIAEPAFGSVSYYARGNLGRALRSGDILYGCPKHGISSSIGACFPDVTEVRLFLEAPTLLLEPGPQWASFSPAVRREFLATEWKIDLRSDRVGYRLEGKALQVPHVRMVSEPMVVGSVQIPPNGLPIVVMRDGPSVGGYPKVAIVREASLDWLAQVRPGGTCSFKLTEP